MSKFGDLLDENIPILLVFYRQDEGPIDLNPILKDVAAAIGDKGKVIKIDVDKNQKLASELNVSSVPTLAIFVKGEIKWRQPGVQQANTLVQLLNKYLV